MSSESSSETSFEIRRVRHDGVLTAYLETTPPAPGADTVLLVHDGWFGADAVTLWSRVVPLLADEFRVVAPDMLGFGGTDKIVYFDRSMYAYRAAHLGSFVRAVCGDQAVHAVGTSMGGSILLRDAVASEPAVNARTVVSISGSGGPWRSSFGAAELGRYDGTLDDIARVLGHMADAFDGIEQFIEARHANAVAPGHAECLLSNTVRHPGPRPERPADPWPAQLAGVRVPTTVVACQQDPLLEPGWEKHLEGISPLLRTEVIDAKHAPSLDHPDLVAAAIRRTVARAAEATAKSESEEP